MNTKSLIEAWQKNEDLSFHTGSNPKIDTELLTRVAGGAQSAGQVCSISAECTQGVMSCEWLGKAFERVIGNAIDRVYAWFE